MTTELEKLVAIAVAQAGGPHPCAILGHKWKHIGGANAGCHELCNCSVPVHNCEICGDCDYGDNKDADDIKEQCLNELD